MTQPVNVEVTNAGSDGAPPGGKTAIPTGGAGKVEITLSGSPNENYTIEIWTRPPGAAAVATITGTLDGNGKAVKNHSPLAAGDYRAKVTFQATGLVVNADFVVT